MVPFQFKTLGNYSVDRAGSTCPINLAEMKAVSLVFEPRQVKKVGCNDVKSGVWKLGILPARYFAESELTVAVFSRYITTYYTVHTHHVRSTQYVLALTDTVRTINTYVCTQYVCRRVPLLLFLYILCAIDDCTDVR